MSSGIKEYWIIDLDQKQVHVYSFKDYSLEHMISYKENDTLTSSLFSDFAIDVQQIMI
jgi:Uma2 family endonuclease